MRSATEVFFSAGVRRRIGGRLGAEEVDARRRGREEAAVLARGLALLADMVGEIRFEDAHREAVEGVVMRGAEEVAALDRARATRPFR